MANIKDALEIVFNLEFSNPKDALEVNATENGYTFMGIYQAANPTQAGWDIVKNIAEGKDRKTASVECYNNPELKLLVQQLYKEQYWDKANLDEINSQHTATEIFVFGVNAGMKKAIKLAQKLVKATEDGTMGPKTISAINAYDDVSFSENFDILEEEYYQAIVDKNATKSIFIKGWKNRARAV